MLNENYNIFNFICFIVICFNYYFFLKRKIWQEKKNNKPNFMKDLGNQLTESNKDTVFKLNKDGIPVVTIKSKGFKKD